MRKKGGGIMTTKVTINEVMQVLKPVHTCNFMDMCANYVREINEEFEYGESHYEISGLNTKSGNPHTFFNY
jgi:hypothetical protein